MSDKTVSILIGGLSIGVVTTILSIFSSNPNSPVSSCIGCFICLLYIGTGLLAVWHYTKNTQTTISGGEGAGMGALAGIVAAGLGGVLGLLMRAIGLLPNVDDLIRQLEDSGQMDQVPAEQLDLIYQIIEVSAGPLGIVIGIVFGVIAGVIGGAIGASVFKKGTDTVGEAPAL